MPSTADDDENQAPLVCGDPQLQKLLARYGAEKLIEYRDALCRLDPQFQELVEDFPEFYLPENAESWVNTREYLGWISQGLQKRAPRKTLHPASAPLVNTSPPTSPTLPPASSPIATPEKPSTSRSKTKSTLVKISQASRDAQASSSSDIDLLQLPTSSPLRSGEKATSSKRKRSASIISLSSDEDDLHSVSIVTPTTSTSLALDDLQTPSVKQQSRKKKSRKQHRESGRVRITRLTSCSELIRLTETPYCWDVPDPDEDGDIAFELDLTGDTRVWLDEKGEPMSMASIIREQDQDAWGDGSSGSIHDLVKVYAFNTDPASKEFVLCRKTDAICQGILHCDYIDMSLLGKRFKAEREGRERVLEAERSIKRLNTTQTKAIALYNELMRSTCKYVDDTGVPCQGKVALRELKKRNFDGKKYMFGCSGWKKDDPKKSDHRLINIPADVDEDQAVQLFKNHGSFTELDDGAVTGPGQCAYVLPRSCGRNSHRKCPHSHVDDNNTIHRGELVVRTCGTRLSIWYPEDKTDRRAIVVLRGAHNHPTPRRWKPTRDAKQRWEQAVKTAGTAGMTAGKVNKAASTLQIYDGMSPAEFDPAFNNSRVMRDLTRKVKKEQQPHGNGLPGVLSRQVEEQSLSSEHRYIHAIHSVAGLHIIVTLFASLARWFHRATASFHDNTYKRLHGDWKEWEVVVWIQDLNMRVTIARIYCQHETREAFRYMWAGFWDAVEKATNEPVKFHFMHGTGLLAILVDGCKTQVDGCGDALLERLRACSSPLVHESDPQVLVQHIVKLCSVHLDRNFNELKAHCTADEMDVVRRCRTLETREAVDEFWAFCHAGSKKLRDWALDKGPYPWFLPSVNMYLSKMSRDTWHSTPNSTNLNESAHPQTNANTGINLPLLEAIDTARDYDTSVAKKIEVALESGIDHNAQNTTAHRMRKNIARAAGRAKKAAVAKGAEDRLTTLQDEERHHRESIKKLKDERKKIQEETGCKSKPKAVPSKFVAAVQDLELSAMEESSDLPTPSTPLPQASDLNVRLSSSRTCTTPLAPQASTPTPTQFNIAVSGTPGSSTPSTTTHAASTSSDTTGPRVAAPHSYYPQQPYYPQYTYYPAHPYGYGYAPTGYYGPASSLLSMHSTQPKSSAVSPSQSGPEPPVDPMRTRRAM